MLDVRIRRTKSSDYEDIKEIYDEIGLMHKTLRPDVFTISSALELSKKNFEECVRTHYMISAVIIVRDVERVVGFLDAVKQEYPFSKDSSLFIKGIGVREKYRKHGIGTYLMEKAEAFAKRNGMFVALDVWNINRRALAFLERLGYVPRIIKLEKKISDLMSNENDKD